MQQYDVVILGAGAAGLMCAQFAARRGRRVLVLDHARQAGEKILISGGGRCNFTNIHTAAARFLSENPAFCRSALARYTPQDFLQLVEKHRITWHEKTLGQLFCDGSARQIVAMLLAECEAAGAQIRLQEHIGEISRADTFLIETKAGLLASESLVLATGGLSIPKIGATDLSHRVAARFGLKLTDIRPGLVPLLLPEQDLGGGGALAGVSLPVQVSHGKIFFAEGMVFTHRGLSGPAILQISSYWKEGDALDLNFLPDQAPGQLMARKRQRPKAGLRGILGEILPQRLADSVLTHAEGAAPRAAGPIAEIQDRALVALEDRLRRWRVVPQGTEGYAKAEVTLGGVDTNFLHQTSLQSRHVPGLFVIGEAVDITGWLGGYNFQWAWASGAAAGAYA